MQHWNFFLVSKPMLATDGQIDGLTSVNRRFFRSQPRKHQAPIWISWERIEPRLFFNKQHSYIEQTYCRTSFTWQLHWHFSEKAFSWSCHYFLRGAWLEMNRPLAKKKWARTLEFPQWRFCLLEVIQSFPPLKFNMEESWFPKGISFPWGWFSGEPC